MDPVNGNPTLPICWLEIQHPYIYKQKMKTCTYFASIQKVHSHGENVIAIQYVILNLEYCHLILHALQISELSN